MNIYFSTLKRQTPILLLFLACLMVNGNASAVSADVEKHADGLEEIQRLYAIGQEHLAGGRFDQALTNFQGALDLTEQYQQKEGKHLIHAQMGMACYALGRHDQAGKHFQKALANANNSDSPDFFCAVFTNLGLTCYARCLFDQAAASFEQALRIAEQPGSSIQTAPLYSYLGMVHHAWARYDTALDYYRKALSQAETRGFKDMESGNLRNIGLIYQARRQFDQAMDHYHRSLAVAGGSGNKSESLAGLNCLGSVYFQLRRFDDARDCYARAIQLSRELQQKDQMARGHIHMGGAYHALGKLDLALEQYQEAWTILRTTGFKADMITCLNNQGLVRHARQEYGPAAACFQEAVSLIEEIRNTAQGEIRRDYLASQLAAYGRLVSTHIRNKEPEKAFNVTELSSAKYLAEKLSPQEPGKNPAAFDIGSEKQLIPAGTVVIKFANFSWNQTSRIWVAGKSVHGLEVPAERLLDGLPPRMKRIAADGFVPERGLVRKKDGDTAVSSLESPDTDQGAVARLIHYYRQLLTLPRPTGEDEQILRRISAELYGFLFSGMEQLLENQKELVILPDDVLCLLPFETLIMPDGRYLCQRFIIRYAQSLTVAGRIARKKYTHPRKSILALGGPVFGRSLNRYPPISSPEELEALKKKTLAAIQERAPLQETYGRLGLAEWEDIPGALEEVQTIQKLMPDGEMVVGRDLTEEFIKKASLSGLLTRFKTIHFATHAVAVPEIPELSAIVLSHTAESAEDGFLRMEEIAGLRIQADFVNLSACNTGLGKVYSGEGMVGLTQAFLLAGANSLCVSLWPVADQGTTQFMVALYQMARKTGSDYPRAIHAVKRRFIAGDFGADFQRPYYWAPFVYYGPYY
ncbi:MAG: CHAT domain-containing protein [Thermodesulfobacteriota bacterium]